MTRKSLADVQAAIDAYGVALSNLISVSFGGYVTDDSEVAQLVGLARNRLIETIKDYASAPEPDDAQERDGR